MLKKYYKIRVCGKNVRRFIKSLYNYNIYLKNINISDYFFTAIIDKESLDILLDIKTCYDIEIIETLGIMYYKEMLRTNFIFILSFFIGFLVYLCLSNIIFDVEIVTNDIDLEKKLMIELEKYEIRKYTTIKKYDYIQDIKNKILNDFNSSIDWIEIERLGTKYYVKLEKRIINVEKEKDKYRHVIAKRDGVLKKIVARDGEVVKKINDYVNRGEIIISGEIHKGDDVKDNIPADGDIFAEVWYKVNVVLPVNYYEKKLTGDNKNVFNIRFLTKNINVFDNNKYLNKQLTTRNLYNDFYDMFSINFNEEKKLFIEDDVNTITSENIAIKYAREKILNILDKGEYIISQKKLKTIINDSTIKIEVFFKVYENISQYKYYLKEGD